MTVWPFILASRQLDEQTINHERIHLRQQAELLILPLYMLYFLEYGIRLIQYRNNDKAYRNISFEREAYENETNLFYLNNRRAWSWLNYLKK